MRDRILNRILSPEAFQLYTAGAALALGYPFWPVLSGLAVGLLIIGRIRKWAGEPL